MDEYEDDPADTTLAASPFGMVVTLLLGAMSWWATWAVLGWGWRAFKHLLY